MNLITWSNEQMETLRQLREQRRRRHLLGATECYARRQAEEFRRLLRGSAVYQYSAKIVEWKDGDTPVIDIDLGFSVRTRQIVRVFGINTPETRSADADEKRRGLAALQWAQFLAPAGAVVTVRSTKPGGGDKFGRYLATITLEGGRDYSAEMIAKGHALPWDGAGVKPI